MEAASITWLFITEKVVDGEGVPMVVPDAKSNVEAVIAVAHAAANAVAADDWLVVMVNEARAVSNVDSAKRKLGGLASVMSVNSASTTRPATHAAMFALHDVSETTGRDWNVVCHVASESITIRHP